MGFRFGWWGKWGGFTWGPKGGWRLYGMTQGRKKKSATGCLIPIILILGTGGALTTIILGIVRNAF